MAIRDILTVKKDISRESDSILRQKCQEIVEFNSDRLHKLVADLIETMDADPIAIGLAAPQIGVDAAVAVVSSEIVQDETHLVMVNPEIVSQSGKKDIKRESCMSLPPWGGDVGMRKKLRLAFSGVDGVRTERDFTGFAARVVRHEVDHLDGILYVDYVDGNLVKLDIFE